MAFRSRCSAPLDSEVESFPCGDCPSNARRLHLAPLESRITDIVARLVQLSMDGDIQAAKLLFEACGFVGRAGGESQNVNNINVLVERARDQEREPQTVEAVFAVIDEKVAAIQRYRELIADERAPLKLADPSAEGSSRRVTTG